MKCEICGKKNKNKGWDARYCSTCGLYLDEIDKEMIIIVIDEMIERWDSPKQFDYYSKSTFEGESIYKFKYRVVKKIIDNIDFANEVTLKEVECLIQIISYLSIEFEYNVTRLAITLFWFINDNLINCDKILNYWIKRGQKEKVRCAFEAEYCILFGNHENGDRAHKSRMRKLKNILRHLPNDED